MTTLPLPGGKKIYFASDFHLGAPDEPTSRERELSIIAWLDSITKDAYAIFLLGDIFDFWFEYRQVVPKGYIRLQGKLAELSDEGIKLFFFTGNHDMWMFDYFPSQMHVTIIRNPETFVINKHKIMVGHGDGLGPGDVGYRFLKYIFTNRVCQWLFARIHPNLGLWLAHAWSKKSRVASGNLAEQFHKKEDEHLYAYCKQVEAHTHHDYYIFGHRHLPLDLAVSDNCRYINTGEWVLNPHYAVYDGTDLQLKKPE